MRSIYSRIYVSFEFFHYTLVLHVSLHFYSTIHNSLIPHFLKCANFANCAKKRLRIRRFGYIYLSLRFPEVGTAGRGLRARPLLFFNHLACIWVSRYVNLYYLALPNNQHLHNLFPRRSHWRNLILFVYHFHFQIVFSVSIPRIFFFYLYTLSYIF